ncbi:hypothetical protein KEM48_008336 [Puccinia striiformis f. sp. tritici PST-130]|nr:hypothetical protein KEM48_008336 [Puccinia striiformis f. sp. tritici PST-130]
MRLLEKAKKQALKTHKDRVADFNTRLENQSEHFDIPKVPFTLSLFDFSKSDLAKSKSSYSRRSVYILIC